MSQLTDEELKSAVEDLIRTEIFLRDVPYSMQDGLQELDPDSVDDASKAIVKFFKEQYVVDKYTSKVVLSDSPVVDVIKKIPQQPQVQYDLNRQLRELRMCANKLGLYDAADFLKR